MNTYSDPTPGDMIIIAEGEAPSWKEAIEGFTAHAQEFSAIIAVGANATIAQLEPEVAFEITPGETKRFFFQRFVPADGLSLSSRFVEIDATSQMISALYASKERGRLIRAVSQYYEALKYWRNGYELLALAHLFMGIEAVKTAYWRHKTRKDGISKEDLAKSWGYEKSGTYSLAQALDAASREILVFQDDTDTLKTAKATSDTFEHGSNDLGSLRPQLVSVW